MGPGRVEEEGVLSEQDGARVVPGLVSVPSVARRESLEYLDPFFSRVLRRRSRLFSFRFVFCNLSSFCCCFEVGISFSLFAPLDLPLA